MRGGKDHDLLRDLPSGRAVGDLEVDEQRLLRHVHALQVLQDSQGRGELGAQAVG